MEHFKPRASIPVAYDEYMERVEHLLPPGSIPNGGLKMTPESSVHCTELGMAICEEAIGELDKLPDTDLVDELQERFRNIWTLGMCIGLYLDENFSQ